MPSICQAQKTPGAGTISWVWISSTELADGICCALREPCVLQKLGPLPGKDTPLPVTVPTSSLNWKKLDSSLLFLEAPASGEASLLSEGLRESLSSYISMTEENSLDDV